MKTITKHNPGIKEKDIQRQIIDFLELKGWVVIKAPTSGIYNPEKQFFRPLRQKGISDLLCCAKGGAFVAIEIKAPGGKLSDHQCIFLDQVRRAGGKAIVAYSLDTVIEFVKYLSGEGKDAFAGPPLKD